MRIIKAVWLACGALIGALVPVIAQEACTPGPDALGVSRVAEIDTSAGPRFGFQYKEQDVLADGEVVLTFDDGPLRPYSRPILEALAAHCTKATFFLVGRMAVADPEMVREYARLGHTIGIHTWSHANLHSITPLRARTEIELGFSAVQQALGKPVAPFFRFPYLADTKSLTTHLQERHVGIFSIDVDSKDYRSRNPESVHRKVMSDLARAKKGKPAVDLFSDFNGLDDFAKKLEFYQHDQHWTNRLILGDSLLVMASLAEKERLRGKVQCVYFDPPYGIKFGSNWQVSTRKRDVKDAKAEDLTRQPEQIKAFRDTWELGIHSYLTYLRDRLAAARDLLTESGSIFVQIGDENVHLVRALLDEVFGSENLIAQISAKKDYRTNDGVSRWDERLRTLVCQELLRDQVSLVTQGKVLG